MRVRSIYIAFFISYVKLMSKYVLNEVMNNYENGPGFLSTQSTVETPELPKQNVNYVSPSYLFSCHVVLPSIFNRKQI